MWLQGYDVDILRRMTSFSYKPLLEKLQANQDRILPRFQDADSYELAESIFGCIRVSLAACQNRLEFPPAVPKIFEREEIKSTIREIDEGLESFYENGLCKEDDPALAFFKEIKSALQSRLAELRALKGGPQTPNGPFI